MSVVVRRTFFAVVLVLVLLATGAWQSDHAALAKSQAASLPDIPLYPGLTWSDPAVSTRDIRISINGDSISRSGERYEALTKFDSGLPQDVLDYYSNKELAKSGWTSYDAFDGSDGIHYVFYHESGVYLSVEFLKCADAPSSTCLAVWKSEQVQPTPTAPGTTSEPGSGGEKTTFGKISPTDGQTGLDPTSTTLSWQAYPGADKYKYCVNEGSACARDDTDWTSTYSRSVTLTNLGFNRLYYWHVKATTCELCVPKPWYYSDNDTPWRFRTRTGTGNQVTILGNAGVGGAVLSFTDGIARSVTADSTGAYSLRVSYNWTGTVTPSKSGYIFSPVSASFTNLIAPQTIQNFSATAVYVISGNAGLPGVTLSYVNGTPRTVVSDANGNYSIPVLGGWSGTVTPSKTSYVFSPASRTYTNISANQTGQNYTATLATFTISGNTGVAGVTLRYTYGTPRSVQSDGSGNYSITVPYNWSGTVTPSKIGYLFAPVNRTYSNVVANQVGQNYAAIPLYSISGNAGVAGATLSYTDGTPRTVLSQVDGSYSLTVPAGWSGSVTPTHACFTFSPASRNYTNLASNQPSQDFAPTVKAGCADVSVLVSGANQGRFGLASQGSARASFRNLSGGPVKIASSNAISLMAAERVIFKANNINTSYSEMMGLPNSQLDNTYWLPVYNSVDLDSQLRIANVSSSTATVHLYIHGIERTSGCSPSNSPFTLAAGATLRVSCTGINDGPVKIVSNQNIVAAERMVYNVNGVNTSYSEMMALPNSQLNTTYWLPWYNNVDLDTQLRFANVSASPATVHISIGGQEVNGSPFILQPGGSNRVSLAGVSSGPVKIESNQNIVASERVIYRVNNVSTSYSEMMALPNSQANTIHWLPWYNNVDLDTQLRIANVSGSPATVHVFIGGQEVNGSPLVLQPGESNRISAGGVSDGPVKIQSDQNIVVSERVIYRVNNVNTSFSEMMALPNSLLDTIYWWPWYNNADIDTQLRFGRP